MHAKKLTVLLALSAASGALMAQTTPAAADAPKSDWTITGNASLNSDYRFRGFTQTNYRPALQGGIDIAHKSGFYIGNWNSNVKDTLYNGGSLEMDFYGGYKGEISGFSYDLGAIYYYYPGSGKDSFSNVRIDNKELYAGAGWGPLTAKLFYALGDYFKTAALVGAPNSTKGTTYLDLNYGQEFAGVNLGAHLGYLSLRNNGQFTTTFDTGAGTLPHHVTDWKLSAGKEYGGFMFTAAVVGTSKKGFFATDLSGAKAAGKTGLVLSVGKTF